MSIGHFVTSFMDYRVQFDCDEKANRNHCLPRKCTLKSIWKTTESNLVWAKNYFCPDPLPKANLNPKIDQYSIDSLKIASRGWF